MKKVLRFRYGRLHISLNKSTNQMHVIELNISIMIMIMIVISILYK